MLKQGDNPESARKWYVMAAVAIGIFLATIDASIVNIALPVLEQDLHTDFAVVEWVVLAYLTTATTLMLSVGRKPLYAIGMVVVLMVVALLLSLWALRQERRLRADKSAPRDA